MKQIDKFLKRMRKTEKLKKENSLKPQINPPSDESAESTDANISEADEVVGFCNEHHKIVSDFLNSETSVLCVDEPQLKVEKVLIEPIADALYNNHSMALGEVIELDGEIFPVSQPAQANYGKGYKLRNIREIILNNSLQNASNLVRVVADSIKSGEACNKFYLLSDTTDVFGVNIKSAFNGYRMVWRSIAVAYMMGNFDKLSVADFMADSITKITVAVEISDKYNRLIYTRTDRKNLSGLTGLSYYAVAKAFAKHILTKNNCSSQYAIENMAVSNKLYGVMCNGAKERFVVGNKLICATGEEYSDFIDDYLEAYGEQLRCIGCKLIWADHLKSALKGGGFVDCDRLPEVLNELDFRVKNNIPLWVETLPSLKLDRVALHGRLGNYYLVEAGKKVENTFESKIINCPEILVLPAGEKEIIFPLSISGVTDRHYIAKVTLEEPFKTDTECNVELKYDFNNEKTYSFNLYDKVSGKAYYMYIEEGEPERDEKPFEMKIDADIEQAMDLLMDKFMHLKDYVAGRKKQRTRYFSYDRDAFKEKSWEIDARKTCNEIYSLWLRLPYEVKKDKNNFSELHAIIENIIYDCSIPDYYDAIDRLKVMTVRCVAALFIDGYDIKISEYQETVNGLRNENITSENTALYVISSRILSNPSICDSKLIDLILKHAPDKARLLSLPLIANDALLEFMATYKMGELCDIVQGLEKALYSCTSKIRNSQFDLGKTRNVLKQIRDYWEFALGILRLRKSEFWNDNLAWISRLKDNVYKLEDLIFSCYNRYYKQWMHDICFTRIQFNGIPESLNLMHPLAYTLITYLEGNPNTHIIGCGLREE